MMRINRYRDRRIERIRTDRKCAGRMDEDERDGLQCRNIAEAQAIFGDDFSFNDVNFDDVNGEADEGDLEDEEEEEEDEEDMDEIAYDDDGNPIEDVSGSLMET